MSLFIVSSENKKQATTTIKIKAELKTFSHKTEINNFQNQHRTTNR
jgi:hypothetical protein